MRILIVDDDRDVLDLIATFLASINADVTKAVNVQQAIDFVDNNAFYEYYDVVITDINMPGPDGTQLIKYIRSKGISAPIIAITGGVGDSVDEYVQYAELFADETLKKPFTRDALIAAVENLSSSRENGNEIDDKKRARNTN